MTDTATGPAQGPTDRPWATTALSRVGATHSHRGIVCQDRSRAAAVGDLGDWASEGEGGWAYVVVADGHGAAPHFRSHVGAELAVDCMERAFRALHRQLLGSDAARPGAQATTGTTSVDPLLTDHWAGSAARFVISQWRVLVYENLLSDPPGDPDIEPGLARMLNHLRERHGQTAERRMREQLDALQAHAAADAGEGSPTPLPLPSGPRWDPDTLGSWHAAAYGTTLLGALVSPRALYWFRLGDGAMVRVADGQPDELSPPPAGALANETPSLSDDDAANEAEVRAVPFLDGHAPDAVILASDGVPNSFTEYNGFLAFCTEIAQRAATDRRTVTGRLPSWLDQLSRGGSGDDLSVAMTWHTADGDGARPDVTTVAGTGADDGAGAGHGHGDQRDREDGLC